jgi:hypothetical protein
MRAASASRCLRYREKSDNRMACQSNNIGVTTFLESREGGSLRGSCPFMQRRPADEGPLPRKRDRISRKSWRFMLPIRLTILEDRR